MVIIPIFDELFYHFGFLSENKAGGTLKRMIPCGFYNRPTARISKPEIFKFERFAEICNGTIGVEEKGWWLDEVAGRCVMLALGNSVFH